VISSLNLSSAPEKKADELMDIPMMQLLGSISAKSYLGEVETPASEFVLAASTSECHVYSDWEVFKYNFGIWCLGFFCLGC
jgi:hypothetical protein